MTTPVSPSQPTTEDDVPAIWLDGALKNLARELLADPKTYWIGERDPKQHICWTAAERLASLKARVEELEAKTSLVTFNEACKRIEALEAALRQSTDKLGKVAGWLDRLATAAGKSAANCSYESLREAYIADANNYRKTVADIKPTLEAARAALPQSSTPAVSR